MESSGPLPVDQWTRVRITFDEKELKLYLNGRTDTAVPAKLLRTYGNCTVFIGKGFHGRLDNIAVLGTAASPDSAVHP